VESGTVVETDTGTGTGLRLELGVGVQFQYRLPAWSHATWHNKVKSHH
jgi:hypothetical protein